VCGVWRIRKRRRLSVEAAWFGGATGRVGFKRSRGMAAACGFSFFFRLWVLPSKLSALEAGDRSAYTQEWL
jgi:hypothetical protein